MTTVDVDARHIEIMVKLHNRRHRLETSAINDRLMPCISVVGTVKVPLFAYAQPDRLSTLITLNVEKEALLTSVAFLPGFTLAE